MKLKWSKISLFINDTIALYGYKFSIREKKIYPMYDKLQGLLCKAQPKSVSDMKSFLGSLAFLSEFLPLCSSELAVLHEMTHLSQQTPTFEYNELQQQSYENVLSLLRQPNLIYIHHPDL